MSNGGFVIDTDVVSETAKPRPDPSVMAWLGELAVISLCSIEVDELARGVGRQRIEAEARRQGRTIDGHDLFILATARAHGRTVATRNFHHFIDFGAAVYDPFTGEMSG
jgi:predicted nucleic acid-binding protein